jgi:hypothetical protein
MRLLTTLRPPRVAGLRRRPAVVIPPRLVLPCAARGPRVASRALAQAVLDLLVPLRERADAVLLGRVVRDRRLVEPAVRVSVRGVETQY